MQGGKERVAAMGTSSNGMAAGGSGGSLGSEGIATRIGDKLTDMADRITGRNTQSGTSE